MSPLTKSLVTDDELKNFFEIVDLSFMSRRKNIKNNLKSMPEKFFNLQKKSSAIRSWQNRCASGKIRYDEKKRYAAF